MLDCAFRDTLRVKEERDVERKRERERKEEEARTREADRAYKEKLREWERYEK
jgi:hypothetical protein